jgi:4-hydroxy-3-methylbut-2-en-1-yl diphosphate reductase
LAYEAVEHFPDKKLHITNELIHNPEVNDKLLAMNVNFIEKVADGTKDFSTIGDGDVVILPAFGASFEEMQLFNDRVCTRTHTDTCTHATPGWRNCTLILKPLPVHTPFSVFACYEKIPFQFLAHSHSLLSF